MSHDNLNAILKMECVWIRWVGFVHGRQVIAFNRDPYSAPIRYDVGTGSAEIA